MSEADQEAIANALASMGVDLNYARSFVHSAFSVKCAFGDTFCCSCPHPVLETIGKFVKFGHFKFYVFSDSRQPNRKFIGGDRKGHC